jgi:hypothetical protein
MMPSVGLSQLLTALEYAIPTVHPSLLPPDDSKLFVQEESSVFESRNSLLNEDESSGSDDAITIAIAGCAAGASEWQDGSEEIDDALHRAHMICRKRDRSGQYWTVYWSDKRTRKNNQE